LIVISDMYYQPNSLIQKDNSFINANELNEMIYSCVDTLGLNEISSPIYTDEGCFFIRLIDKKKTTRISLS